MAEIKLTGINKIFPGGTHAVHDVDLQIRDGEFMIMVGPSGCAKSTILRIIAGLEIPTAGTVEIGGRVVNDVAPKDRDIAMVFQSYALYPHMTVAENMAFGLRLRKMPPTEIEQRVNEAARILGLEQLLARLPKQMSGGQRQRVAMGRAIVREPQAFLMDEPLSNLDAKLRVQMRTEIAKLHKRLCTTTVYVTHDQVEAMTLGQRICILRRGVVQQVDTPHMVYTNPNNVFVGGFIGSPGMNFMSGHLLLHDGYVYLQLGEHHLPLPPSVTARLLSSTDINGRGVIVGVRPEHLSEAAPGDASGHALPVDVELTEAMGSEAYAYFNMNVPTPDLSELSDTQAVSSTFVAKLPPGTRATSGEPLWLRMDLDHLHLFDPQTQLTLLSPIDEHALADAQSPIVVAGPVAVELPAMAAFAPRPVLHGYVPAPAIAPGATTAVQPVINLHQTFAVPAPPVAAPAAIASPFVPGQSMNIASDPAAIAQVFDTPVHYVSLPHPYAAAGEIPRVMGHAGTTAQPVATPGGPFVSLRPSAQRQRPAAPVAATTPATTMPVRPAGSALVPRLRSPRVEPPSKLFQNRPLFGVGPAAQADG